MVLQKLSILTPTLNDWGRKDADCFSRKIFDCKELISKLKRQNSCQANATYVVVRNRLANLHKEKETYWKQRVEVQWLRSGNSNTRFFHSCASSRKRKNHIESLIDANGNRLAWDDDIQNHIVEYYTALFWKTQELDLSLVDGINGHVSLDQTMALCASITKEEVRAAIFSMHPDKAPGPDGYNPGYFYLVVHMDSPKQISLEQNLNTTDLSMANGTGITDQWDIARQTCTPMTAVWHPQGSTLMNGLQPATQTHVTAAIILQCTRQLHGFWQAPSLPFVKCNSDASLTNNGEQVGFGLIVRNSGIRFCAAKARFPPASISILEAETLSVREALSWLKNVGYTHVIIEVDNITLYISRLD